MKLLTSPTVRHHGESSSSWCGGGGYRSLCRMHASSQNHVRIASGFDMCAIKSVLRDTLRSVLRLAIARLATVLVGSASALRGVCAATGPSSVRTIGPGAGTAAPPRRCAGSSTARRAANHSENAGTRRGRQLNGLWQGCTLVRDEKDQGIDEDRASWVSYRPRSRPKKARLPAEALNEHQSRVTARPRPFRSGV